MCVCGLLMLDIKLCSFLNTSPLSCPHTFSQVHPYISFDQKKFWCACLFTILMAFGHFKWLELPPPASTLTFFRWLHSFVYLILNFRHTTKNQRGKPAYMYTLQLSYMYTYTKHWTVSSWVMLRTKLKAAYIHLSPNDEASPWQLQCGGAALAHA